MRASPAVDARRPDRGAASLDAIDLRILHEIQRDGRITTETLVMRSSKGTIRFIKATHRELEKFAAES